MPRDSTPSSSEPAWEPCPPGTFAAVADRLRLQQQRRRFLRYALALTGAVGVAAGLVVAVTNPELFVSTPDGPLSCPEIQDILRASAGGAVIPNRRERVRAHLAYCQRCRQLAQELNVRV
jgi:hypothetical protein